MSGTTEDIFGGGDDDLIYHVFTNDVNDNRATLTLSGALPVVGSAHPNFLLSTCRGLEFDRRGKFFWTVTARYSTNPEGQTELENRNVESPLLRAPAIRLTSSLYVKPVVEDNDGKAVVNSAGDYFDPPPEIEDPRWQITITSNIENVSPIIIQYAGAVNENPCTIRSLSFDAETLKIVGLDISEPQFENFAQYSEMTMVLELRFEGWDLRLLDQGFHYLDVDELKKIQIKDPEGNLVFPSSPVKLRNGQHLQTADPNDADYLDFKVTRLLPFNGLPGII